MKPYRRLPILESHEPLVPIPDALFLRTDPHPYESLGAPYGDTGPWWLRQGVLAALIEAQGHLDQTHPGYKIKLFDAYRPNRVQAFMVDIEFLSLSGGIAPEVLAPKIRASLYEKAFRIWAEPSSDPLTPPPHSTGAAIDMTLADQEGKEINMGSPIDENSDRSSPDYFRDLCKEAHENRQILARALTAAGFTRHPDEWWHFSLGDQMWVYRRAQEGFDEGPARYGRADLIRQAAQDQRVLASIAST